MNTCYIKALAFWTIALTLPTNSFAQEELKGLYEVTQLPDGTPVERYMINPNDQGRAKVVRFASALALRSHQKSQGIGSILDSLSIEQIESLSEFEFVGDQRDDLSALLKEYREALDGLDESSSEAQYEKIHITTEHHRKLQGILLPDQIRSIANNIKLKKYLFKRLTSPLVSDRLELTEYQMERLGDQTRSLNDEIKQLIAEVETKMASIRKRAKTIYDTTLNADQREMVEEAIEVENLLKEMSIQDLREDTSIDLNDSK